MDRIPRYDSIWEDAVAAWHQQGLPADVEPADYFDWDIVSMAVDVSMRQEQKLIADDGEYVTVQDRFGYTVRKAKGRAGTMAFSNLATPSRERWQQLRLRFRLDPGDEARVDDASYFLHMQPYPSWGEAKAKYDRLRATGKWLMFNSYGPWEATWRHRGMSELLMDTATDPDWVHDMGAAVVDLLIDVLRYGLGLGMKPDSVWLIDDLAGTRGLIFAPETWRRIYKPLYRRLGDFLHANGISFWLHACGKTELLFDDFIECGLDVIQPLQAHSGLDVRNLKPKYGDRLTFWGNIDARKMDGPADALEAEIRDKLTVAKAGGGYIYHSDHSVPCTVDFQRYQWIMEQVERYGRY